MEAALSGVLPRAVNEAAARHGDAAVFVDADGRPTSFRELDRLSDEAAAGLVRRGIGPGSVVALMLRSTPDYAIAYLASAKAGAITSGINPRLAPPEQASVLDLLEPDLVIEDAPQLSSLRVRDETPPALDDDPARAVSIVLTSGTTGSPAGAVFTNRQLEAIARMETPGTGPMLSSTEFAHIGFMTKFHAYLLHGRRIHLLRRWRPADALRTVAEQRISSLGGISAQIALMVREPTLGQYDLGCVKAIVAGGGPSPPSLVREARERFNAPYSIRYSSTESGGLGTMTSFDAPDEEALYTVGRPRPGIDLEIRDGEVCLRSPAVMDRYWRDPDGTADVLRDGWLRTGDLGVIDGRGCLRLAGRRKEMFVRGGYNVYPAHVESVLSSHPLVADVAVVPRPDDLMGEIGVAVVVPADSARPPALDDLRDFATDKLARHELPEALKIVEAIPLTSMHKIDRRALETIVG